MDDIRVLCLLKGTQYTHYRMEDHGQLQESDGLSFVSISRLLSKPSLLIVEATSRG